MTHINTSHSVRRMAKDKVVRKKDLWHARGAFGALIPKDEHHPRPDLARCEGRIEPVQAVEALCHALEPDALGPRDLRDRGPGCEVPPQDGDVARALYRVREPAHSDVLRRLPNPHLRRVRHALR